MFQKQNIHEDILILAVDLTCIVISILISYALRYGSHVGVYLQSDAGWIIGGICFIYIVLNVFVDLNHHFFRRGYIDEFLNVIKAMSILLVIFIVVLYLMHVSTSFARLVFGYFAISGTLLMFLGRICLKRFMLTFYKKSKFSNRMILITTSDRAKEIIAHLYERNDWNRVLSGIILSIGRIVGESAALLYTAGTVAAIPESLFSSGRTLSVHMYALLSEGLYVNEAHATALVLLIMVLLINFASGAIAALFVRERS